MALGQAARQVLHLDKATVVAAVGCRSVWGRIRRMCITPGDWAVDRAERSKAK